MPVASWMISVLQVIHGARRASARTSRRSAGGHRQQLSRGLHERAGGAEHHHAELLFRRRPADDGVDLLPSHLREGLRVVVRTTTICARAARIPADHRLGRAVFDSHGILHVEHCSTPNVIAACPHGSPHTPCPRHYWRSHFFSEALKPQSLATSMPH